MRLDAGTLAFEAAGTLIGTDVQLVGLRERFGEFLASRLQIPQASIQVFDVCKSGDVLQFLKLGVQLHNVIPSFFVEPSNKLLICLCLSQCASILLMLLPNVIDTRQL